MKEKYIKLESVLTALYSNKRIDDGDIDSKVITDILTLPTKEIETVPVIKDVNIHNDVDSWRSILEELLEKQKSPQDNYWTTLMLNPYVPEACKHCLNHPSNGGSGICHCTLGTQVTC